MLEIAWYWLPLVVYAWAIAYVSSLSHPALHFQALINTVNTVISAEGNIFSNINDKTYHFMEYTILGALAYRALRHTLGNQWVPYIGCLAVAAVVVYGCTDELHQWYVPFRQMDVWDVVADTFGGMMGVGLWHAVSSVPCIRMWEAHILFKLQIARSVMALKF